MNRIALRWLSCLFVILVGGLVCTASATDAPTGAPLTIIVMDPLALELSCPCVKGYAQRDYHRLAEFLQQRLKRPVELAFSESLVTALKDKTSGRADLIIGKASVVRHDAARAKLPLQSVASLTGKDGSTTQHGLIVVRAEDKAKTVANLAGYRVIFGPAECDEKHAAALALLKASGVAAPQTLETRAACDEGATLILELPPEQHGAAVISSYAKPLLEGCGTVPKGALRVVGQTEPVAFVTAFVHQQLDGATREALNKALLAVADDPLLCLALETKHGFVAMKESVAKKN